MLQMLVEGKPGYKPEGKGVYRNFVRDVHMSQGRLVWKQEIDRYTGQETHVPLYMGWDDLGDAPAAVVVQRVAPMSFQVLREFYDDRMGIVDFGHWVMETMLSEFPELRWRIPAIQPGSLNTATVREG